MKLLNLNPQPGRVLIGPMGNTQSGFSYSWQLPSINPGFNDGSSENNILFTDDPADPITYLTWNNAYITNVATFDLGGGTWNVTFDVVHNAGGTTTITSKMNAHGVTFDLVLPGYVIYDMSFTVVTGSSSIKLNGTPKTVPFTAAPNDAVTINAAVSVSIIIQGNFLVSDNRMIASPPGFTNESGNITITPNVNNPVNHVMTFACTITEDAPFGGTDYQVSVDGTGIIISGNIGI